MRNPILVLALSAVLGTGLSTAVAAGETVACPVGWSTP